MKTLCLIFLAATFWAILTPGSPEPAPKALAHVYIAYRVIPYFGKASAASGMIILNVDDGEGGKAVVGLPPEIIEQIISMSKKTAISYVRP